VIALSQVIHVCLSRDHHACGFPTRKITSKLRVFYLRTQIREFHNVPMTLDLLFDAHVPRIGRLQKRSSRSSGISPLLIFCKSAKFSRKLGFREENNGLDLCEVLFAHSSGMLILNCGPGSGLLYNCTW
jgi:hypothetical protein